MATRPTTTAPTKAAVTRAALKVANTLQTSPQTDASPELLAALDGVIARLAKQSTPGSELSEVVAAAQAAVVVARQKDASPSAL